MKEAKPLTLDGDVIDPHKLKAEYLVELLRVMLKGIKRYDDEIAELAPQHPDFSWPPTSSGKPGTRTGRQRSAPSP